MTGSRCTCFFNQQSTVTIFLALLYTILLCLPVSAADITATLDNNDGSSAFVIKDSGSSTMAYIDCDGNLQVKGGLRLDSAGGECDTDEMLIVDGKVGIATTNPAGELHLYTSANSSLQLIIDCNGTQDQQRSNLLFMTKGTGAKTMDTDTLGWTFTGRGDSFTQATQQNDLYLHYWDGSSFNTLQYWDHDGNVGIGVSDPVATLEVGGGILSTTYNDTLYTNAYLSGTWKYLANGPAWNLGGWSGDSTVFRVLTAPSGTAGDAVPWRNTLCIDEATGKTGINTSSPGATLEVNGSVIVRSGLRLDSGGAECTTAEMLIVDGKVGIAETAVNYELQVNGDIAWGNETNSYPTTPSGTSLVGFGGTSNYRISIQDGSGRVNKYWNAYYDSGTTTHKYIVDAEGANRFYTSAGNYRFYTAAAGTAGADITWNQGLSQDTNGYVAIGMSPGTYQFQLSLNSAAKPTSNTWTVSSDRRLKKNIFPIEDALDKMLRLNGVTYQWRDPETQGNMDGTYMGLIAQDVEDVFPEWVGEDREGYKNLTISGFEALAAESIRELNTKDRELERENALLRAEIEELRERVNSLEK